MRACIPPGSTDPETLGAFALVGYVAANGTLGSIEVRPRTKVALCFAEHLSQVQFDAPPHAKASVGYPVHVEMRVAP